MQILVLAWIVIVICYGCSDNSSSSQQSIPQVTNPPTVLLPSCADKPFKELTNQEVSNITTSQVLKKSGTVSANRSWGYKFKGNATHKLSVKPSKNLCIWLYSPFQDRTRLTGQDVIALSHNGFYILHVQENHGITKYSLDISITSPSPPPEKVASEKYLSKDDAVKLVNKWLSKKSRILAPPYDLDLAKQLTTGILYEDLTKPNGEIDSLRRNGELYVYRISEINKVISFTKSKNNPKLNVEVIQDLVKKRAAKIILESPPRNLDVTYTFAKEGNLWKIWDLKVNN